MRGVHSGVGLGLPAEPREHVNMEPATQSPVDESNLARRGTTQSADRPGARRRARNIDRLLNRDIGIQCNLDLVRECCGGQLNDWPLFANYVMRYTRPINVKIVNRAGPDMPGGTTLAASTCVDSSSGNGAVRSADFVAEACDAAAQSADLPDSASLHT